MNDDTTQSENDERQQRLNGAYCELLEQFESGTTIDRAAILARHPDLAQELTEFFDSRDFVMRKIDAARPLPLPIGLRVGRFLTSRIISSGPMSIVYEVEDESSPASRPLALKVLPAFGRLDPELRARFHREAEAVAQFNHPNILPIIEVDASGPEPYILMPLVDGPDLRTIRRELARTVVSKSNEWSPGPESDPAVAEHSIANIANRISPSPRLRGEGRGEGPSSDRQHNYGSNSRSRSETYLVANPDSPDDRAALGSHNSHMRAVALVGLQAARALEHAHQREILHRDVKPSNLLLDSQGTVFLTDFGLARQTDFHHADLTATGDLPGTLRYLAPERLRGWCDPRSDVYSLGLTLYELLTLRPVFEYLDRGRLIQAVATTDPLPPRKLDGEIPRDLETIVLKAIEKEPAHRYASATELADDVQRFISGKPIRARCPGPLDRAWKWAQRRRGLVAAGFLGLILLIVVLSLSLLLVHNAEQRAIRAAAEASIERRNALVAASLASAEKQKAFEAASQAHVDRQKALAAARDSQFESLAQRVFRLLLTGHSNGWSAEASKLIDEMGRIRADDRWQSLADAVLSGLDAHVLTSFSPGGDQVLFDPDGRRLLISSIHIDGFRGEVHGTTVYDTLTGARRETKIKQGGPVAFGHDQTPLQLTPSRTNPLILDLWDLARERVIANLSIPASDEVTSERQDHSASTISALTMTADGLAIAVSVRDNSGRFRVYAAHGEQNRQLVRIPLGLWKLALSPDGSLLAGTDERGSVRVWSLSRAVEACPPLKSRLPVDSLAFGRNPRTTSGASGPHDLNAGGKHWWLAAGDVGGSVAIWDTRSGELHVRLETHGTNIQALAFSRDGTTLAAGGHSEAALWDVATGAKLIALKALQFCLGFDFSPDGQRLAATTAVPTSPNFPRDKSEVQVWNLDNGRGIRTFRGLSAPCQQIAFSTDSRYVAGLTNEWLIAIWDGTAGVLKHVLYPPEGFIADQSAMAFLSDGSRFVFASGAHATLWDVESGSVIDRWNLPVGLCNRLTSRASGELVLTRVETKSNRAPVRGADYSQHPRVVRIRALQNAGKVKLLAEVTQFNRHVFACDVTQDGRQVVVDGMIIDAQGERHAITAFDGMTGKPLWTIPRGTNPFQGKLCFDASGEFLVASTNDNGLHSLLKLPSREVVASLPGDVAVSRGAREFVTRNPTPPSAEPGTYVSKLGADRPMLVLRDLLRSTVNNYAFSHDDRFLGLGKVDGTIDVVDLDFIRKRDEARRNAP
jgi:eukaryotic-like serine/threonine-protein kinase